MQPQRHATDFVTQWETLGYTKQMQVYDQGCVQQTQAILPFALTDALITQASQTQQVFLHFWQLDATMILGMKDTRVPDFSAGLSALKTAGYETVLRNAGGLGVIADAGVLNVSLILPQPQEQSLNIEQAYQLLFLWVSLAFGDPTHLIQHGEIAASYCPGAYDLSIHGKKFAGLAQRRIKKGCAIMMYLSVNGDQKKRGQVVQTFYQKSLQEKFGTEGYPPVDPDTMATLAQLLQTSLTVQQAKERLLQTLTSHAFTFDSQTLARTILAPDFSRIYQNYIANMQQRNQPFVNGGINHASLSNTTVAD